MLINGVIPVPPATNIIGRAVFGGSRREPKGPDICAGAPRGIARSVFLNPLSELLKETAIRPRVKSAGAEDMEKSRYDPRES